MSSRINGALVVLAGLILTMVGFGMYRSPHLDWEMLIQSFHESLQTLLNQMNHLINDPFALVGAIVLIIGVVMIFKGLKAVLFE